MGTQREKFAFRAIAIFVILTFIYTSIIPVSLSFSFTDPMPRMPAPGVMVHLSPQFTPAVLKGN